MLSIIIPVYNEERNVNIAVSTIAEILESEKIEHEIIFIDDGSKDVSWEQIVQESSCNQNVRGISFSRNFGKESAIYAGLVEAKGDCAVVIDCDLQHPPKKIVEFYRLWESGYEIVEGVKENRGKESAIYGMAAKMFNSFISKATGMDMSNASDFKLLDRKAINALINMKEKNSFFRALSSWVGFTSVRVPYKVQNRKEGTSKWSKKALLNYTISNIASFTSLPLQIVTFLGILMFVLGVALSVQSFYQWAIGNALEGFTTVIIIQCISSSIIMICMGIIGYYISKIYEGIQNRPKYIISKRIEN